MATCLLWPPPRIGAPPKSCHSSVYVDFRRMPVIFLAFGTPLALFHGIVNKTNLPGDSYAPRFDGTASGSSDYQNVLDCGEHSDDPSSHEPHSSVRRRNVARNCDDSALHARLPRAELRSAESPGPRCPTALTTKLRPLE